MYPRSAPRNRQCRSGLELAPAGVSPTSSDGVPGQAASADTQPFRDTEVGAAVDSCALPRRPRASVLGIDASPLRVALIASAKYPIRQPFAGGMEAHTWALARGLRQRGHIVTVFAGAGCDPDLSVSQITPKRVQLSPAARTDVSMAPADWLQDHHAYLQLMMDLAAPDAPFDVVHNNCLHYLPLATARLLTLPMVSTLHTPPTPWLESAIQTGTCPVHFVAVSQHTARAWQHQIPTVRVISNGVNPDRWRYGAGGGGAVWFGRLVPEKGADLAIRAAHLAGVDLELMGPIGDRTYFDREIAPLLDRHTRYLGHLDHSQLAERVARASVCLVTPRWDEPYGLVVAEALACGTPVCGFDRGALSELLSEDVAVLVAPDDVAALAAGIAKASRLPRAVARDRAVRHCSEDAMVDSYVRLYQELVPQR
jgi:glycosyltransferase involved in cell wall biosynthesis